MENVLPNVNGLSFLSEFRSYKCKKKVGIRCTFGCARYSFMVNIVSLRRFVVCGTGVK